MYSKMASILAKILKLIRPLWYNETVKFKRKRWAHKRVVSNPFLYGQDLFNEDDRYEAISQQSHNNSLVEHAVHESTEDDPHSPEKIGESQVIYENVQSPKKSINSLEDN